MALRQPIRSWVDPNLQNVALAPAPLISLVLLPLFSLHPTSFLSIRVTIGLWPNTVGPDSVDHAESAQLRFTLTACLDPPQIPYVNVPHRCVALLETPYHVVTRHATRSFVVYLVVSFLDIPDLATMSHVGKFLALLTADPVLHRTRLKVVAPSRVHHSLFGRSPEGILFRPTIPELVHRGVMRGLQIERRLRTGAYLYSPHAVKQYEHGLRIQQGYTRILLSSYLRTRLPPPNALKSLYYSHVLPDVESSVLSVSRSLLPVVRQLKWSIQRDNIARIVRAHTYSAVSGNELSHPFKGGFGVWAEVKGANIFGDTERVRLALCPDVRKMVQFYEKMA